MKDTIFRRKSCRKYTGEPLSAEVLQDVSEFLNRAPRLFPELQIELQPIEKQEVRSLCPFLPPQLIAAYAEDAPGSLENIGFLLQHLDLYLQKRGIGTCWIGLGKPIKRELSSLPFAILFAFGLPAEDIIRHSETEFSRKSLSEIADFEDFDLEPARVAPSATNSQPWFFLHEGEIIHAYQISHGLRHALTMGRMNRIDMGIALCHLSVAHPNFHFFLTNAPEKNGYRYVGSFTLH